MPATPSVLDVCCGSRMFWFDKKDPRAVYLDCRNETHDLKDASSKGGSRSLEIAPDVVGDFRNLPFPDKSFATVVFDPPRFLRNGSTGWVAKKYGTLSPTWKKDIEQGFSECFRVLKKDGTLVFKWNESDIPVSQVLSCTPEKPLFGNRCGKNAQSHWLVFSKR